MKMVQNIKAMPGILLFVVMLAVSAQAPAQTKSYTADQKAIKQVVQSAYIDGIHNLGNIQAIKEGFHPGFDMLIKNEDNSLTKFPIYTWIELTEQKKAQNPEGPKEKTTGEFEEIDVTGDAAMVKLNLMRGGKKEFTDYLLLYKFGDKWRIVSKIFDRESY